MKRIIAIVLLSVIIAGCSSIKSEPQADNDVVPEQQTEREEQSAQRIDTRNNVRQRFHHCQHLKSYLPWRVWKTE